MAIKTDITKGPSFVGAIHPFVPVLLKPLVIAPLPRVPSRLHHETNSIRGPSPFVMNDVDINENPPLIRNSVETSSLSFIFMSLFEVDSFPVAV